MIPKKPETKVYPRCKCGCDKTIAGEVVKKMIADGKLSPSVESALLVMQSPISDPTKVPLFGSRIPLIVSLVDACDKCGALRVTKVQYAEAQVNMPASQKLPGSMTVENLINDIRNG
jgi:hypothetical protein